MIIHKFGGGILKTPEAVEQMLRIIQDIDFPTVVVVSAMNKMTNVFEHLVEGYFYDNRWDEEYEEIYRFHLSLAESLFRDRAGMWDRYLEPLFGELRNQLAREHEDLFDQAYDRLVVFGELLSSALIHAVMEERGIAHRLLDVRGMIRTDSTFRDGNVLWPETTRRIQELGISESKELWLTQGFIAANDSGIPVTLGREGSDYTAAIFGHCLDADEVWVWKDVPGVMNADPKEFEHTRRLDRLSYLEAIEMAFFGARVIHPKTIKPLHNKAIPLWVKDFDHPDDPGTQIRQMEQLEDEVPAFILKKDQVLITFQPRDFSFIVEEMISEIFAALHRYRVKVNLMQHAAISLTICVNADDAPINGLISELLPRFRILYNTDLELLTIRRYNRELIKRMTGERRILIQQLSRRTARFVLG